MSVFEGNLAALRRVDGALAERIAAMAVPGDWARVTARDGTATFARMLTLEGGVRRAEWLGATSLPAVAAEAITATLDPKSAEAVNGLGLSMGTGHAWAAFAGRLSAVQCVFVYDGAEALRLALEVCDLSGLLTARKVILLTGEVEEAGRALVRVLAEEPGIEPPTVLHPLPTLGGIGPGGAEQKNRTLAAGEAIVRQGVMARQQAVVELAARLAVEPPKEGVRQVLGLLLTERYPRERPLHEALGDAARLAIDTHRTVSASLRIKLLAEALGKGPVAVKSDLFRAQLGMIPVGVPVETWVPPLVGAGFWERVPGATAFGEGDRVVVHSASHGGRLVGLGLPERMIELRPLEMLRVKRSANPLALRHRVGIVGDLPRIDAEGLGIVLPTHQAIDACARELLAGDYLTVHEGNAGDVLRRACARAGVSDAQAQDPALREPMMKLVRDVLLPTVPLLALAKALAAENMPLALIGDWPERAGLPTSPERVRVVPFGGLTEEAWGEIALLVHLSPTGVVGPTVLEAAGHGVAVLAVEHGTDGWAGSLPTLVPAAGLARPRPGQFLHVLKSLLRDGAPRAKLVAAMTADSISQA